MVSPKIWGGGCCIVSLLWVLACAIAGVDGVKVGVLLDLNTTVGILSKTSIQIALSDFYTANPQYKTRLSLIFKDAGDVVGVALAATELLRDGVEAIIGPQTSEQAMYLTQFGRKYEIPIISFTVTTPTLSPKQNPYFIRAAQTDSDQVEAINDIIQMYGWREIVPIYEDTEYGRGVIPYLADALQESGTQLIERTVISSSASEKEIWNELKRLKEKRKTIFVVHMTLSVGWKVLSVAKKEGMMSEGYAWIVNDGLSSLVDPILNFKVMDSMQGIVGVRPYIPITPRFQHFQTRLKQQLPPSLSLEFGDACAFNKTALPNVFAVQAYDTVWALAMALEKVNQSTNNLNKNLRDTIIMNTKFENISGFFDLVDGELKKPTTFEVFNVFADKEIVIGNWTEGIPLISTNQFKQQPIWPGDTTNKPFMNLRVAIPIKDGFAEFVTANIDDPQNSSGFCIDIFNNAVRMLQIPINFTIIPFVNKSGKSNGSYDELLNQIVDQKVDAVVGDITIVASRSQLVDFTLPFSQSGVTLLVSVRNDDDHGNIWVFLKPFKLNLWAVSFISFIFTGLVVWLLECRVNSEFGKGPPQQQIGLIFWFAASTLTFSNREKILNNLSRFLLIIWIFVVLILTQSYSANLSSMLTAQMLQPSFLDINGIKKNGYSVGYMNGSFVEDYLKNLGFKDTQLKSYGSPDEYKEALDKGIDNNGVAAIFDEIPYIKVFLTRFPSGYRMAGTIYKTDGFGFAFPKGSPLVAYFSRAILNVTEDTEKMSKIENAYFSNEDEETTPIPDSGDSPLDVRRFGGLFIITTVVNSLSLLIYLVQFLLTHWPDSTDYNESSFTSKMVLMVKLFYNLHFRSSSKQANHSRIHSVPATPPIVTTNHVNLTQVAEKLGSTQSSSLQTTHRRVPSFSATPPHVNLAQSSSSLQATQFNAGQSTATLQRSECGEHSVFEMTEATTPNHDNSTKEPHNLGLKMKTKGAIMNNTTN